MKKHWNITIDGIVQGVFFRATARERAGELGVTGYVENRRNGQVFIEAEAEESRLEEFVSWCRQGPPQAKVSEVEIDEGPVMDYRDFTIRR